MVQIPDDKKTRYFSKLEPWVVGCKFLKKDAELLVGTLVHCSLAAPNSHSRLPLISQFTSCFNYASSPFVHKAPSLSVLSDISWWHTQITAIFCGSFLSQLPLPSPVKFWVDALTSWGIGIIFDGEWDFWSLRPGWDKDRCNIGWAKFIAIELGLLFAIYCGHTNIHFIVRSDNQGVIQGRKSRSPEQNVVLKRITLLLASHRLWISSLYILSLNNLADLSS
jgi:hypothetical protein